MPELPEVETLRRQLVQIVPPGVQVTEYKFYRPDLRFPLPKPLQMKDLLHQSLLSVERKSKYLIFNFGESSFLSHLGMSGRWRVLLKHEKHRKHDHILLKWSHGVSLVYEDPRRFGMFDVFENSHSHPLLKQLGIDSLNIRESSAEFISAVKCKKTNIKAALLDQKLISGLGNIYVNEALFLAGISPRKSCQSLSTVQILKLMKLIPPLLEQAIERGGSTLKDYQHLDSGAGKFQEFFKVYGRDGENCLVCKHKIKTQMQSGRSTFWCTRCQK